MQRLKSPLALAAALAGLCAATFAHAKGPAIEELRPVGPWNVKYEDRSCVLQRMLGSDADPFLMRLERFGPGDHFQLVLAGGRLKGMEPPRRFTITYGIDGYAHTLDNFFTGADKNVPTIFVTSTGLKAPPVDGEAYVPVSPAQETAVRQISLSPVRGKTLVLKPGSLGAPFAAWRKCTDDLVKGWGLDPAEQSRLLRPATPISAPDTWIRNGDYPRGALFRGAQAIINFRLAVDQTGMPTQCELQRSYSGELFDQVTCEQLMRNARFQPALDAFGKPIRSFYLNRVVWAMRRPGY